MTKKTAGKTRKTASRKAKPGKFAGRSLHVTAPATAENPGNVADVLASVERLAKDSAQASPSRAAKSLHIVSEARRALAAGDAEGAFWAAWTLAEINGRTKLEGFAETILRDLARQGGTSKGGQTKRANVVPAWEAATAAAVKALGPECSAIDAWRWLGSRRTPVPGGVVTVEGDVLTFIADESDFDGDDATLSFDGWRRYLTEALAESNLRSK